MSMVPETKYRVRKLLLKTTYKPNTGWTVQSKGSCVFLQHRQKVACVNSGEIEYQKGRKFYISPHMTDQEIFRTMYLAIKLFEEHEINENFKVDGERFLNPHPEGARAEVEHV